MQNKADVIKKTRPYRWLYLTTLLSIFVIISAYSMFNLSFTPEARLLLLTHVNSVYLNEDLTQTNTSEGELKQFLHETLADSFTYDYLSFLPQETYKKMVNGELFTELPDQRDRIRAFYSEDAREKLITSLEEAPWNYRFEEERRRLVFSMTTPPTKRGVGAGSEVKNGRLTSDFNGYFYVISQGYNRKSARYRIDFTVRMERRANATRQEAKGYFFRPMAPDNHSEWRINDLQWTAKRAN